MAIGTRQKLAWGQKLKLQRNKNRNERLGLIRSEGGYQRHTMEHQWEQVNALNHEKKIPKTKKMMIFVATHPRHFGISKELGIHLSQIHLLLFYFFTWAKYFSSNSQTARLFPCSTYCSARIFSYHIMLWLGFQLKTVEWHFEGRFTN